MDRLTIIQKIIDSIGAKTYLEIGVSNGYVFFSVDVEKRIGVDPTLPFKLKLDEESKQDFEDGRIYQVTSDLYFDKFAAKDFPDGVEVVFIDGLHTYRQSLRDAQNALKYLSPNGVIVMHDCNPPSFAIAYPVVESKREVDKLAADGLLPGWNNCWCGDVWKTIVHLRLEYDFLHIFTLDLDWGIGIITSGTGEKLNGISIEELSHLEYQFLEQRRESVLNLRNPRYIEEFLHNAAH